MITQFVTIEIQLQPTPIDLRTAIETELRQHGEPLRWALTRVDPATHTATVEAIVTLES